MSCAKIEEVENGYLVTYTKSLAEEEKKRICKDIKDLTETVTEIFSKSES